MAKRTKMWAEKLEKGVPQVVRLDRPFGGTPAGGTLLISSPREVRTFLRRSLRRGKTMDVAELRRRLAEKHGADGCCPLTAGIFLRIVAEHAWDELEAGKNLEDVAPFWRVVDPRSPLAKKLRSGPEWIARQRAVESGMVRAASSASRRRGAGS